MKSLNKYINFSRSSSKNSEKSTTYRNLYGTYSNRELLGFSDINFKCQKKINITDQDLLLGLKNNGLKCSYNKTDPLISNENKEKVAKSYTHVIDNIDLPSVNYRPRERKLSNLF